MKYIFIIILLPLFLNANDDINNRFGETFISNNEEIEIEENFELDNQILTSTGGPVRPPRLPINDYLPLLAVAAVGLGFYYRKEINKTIKSN